MPEVLPYLIWALIKSATDKYHVDPLLFLAIGLTEKGSYDWTDPVIGDINNGWSFSPMQLNLAGAGWGRNPNDLVKPEIWTDVAAGHISYLLGFYGGDIEQTVAAYNRGTGGTFDNSQTYVVPVMENYRRLQQVGIMVVGSGDHDRQRFIPETGKWTGYATEHAPLTGSISEAYDNVLGVATDALEAGRRARDRAQASVDDWGTR